MTNVLLTPRALGSIGMIFEAVSFEKKEMPSAELRNRLTAYGVRAGLRLQDAEDLAQEAFVRVYLWSDGEPRTQDEMACYGFTVFKRLAIDFWTAPGRVMAKRLNELVRKGVLVRWTDAGTDLVGLPEQQARPALGNQAERELDQNTSDFLYSAKGLNGESPLGLTAEQAAVAYLKWAGGAVSWSHLVAQLAGIQVSPRVEITFNDDFDVFAMPETSMGFRPALWDAVAKLPYRWRASVLLMFDQEFLGLGDEIPEERLGQTLDEWTPPPPLRSEDLGFKDQVVAENLGITTNNLHQIRSKALISLRRVLHSFRPDFGGEPA